MRQGFFIKDPVIGQSIIYSTESYYLSSDSQVTTDSLTGCSQMPDSAIYCFWKYQRNALVRSREVQAPRANMPSALMIGLIDIEVFYNNCIILSIGMLVKKIGYTLIIRSQAYKLIYLIAPLLMLGCIFLTAVVPHITEQYKFQEPALRTKISTIQPFNASQRSILFQQVHPGIKLATIKGRLTAESVLLVSECQYPSYQVFGTVHQNIISRNTAEKKLLAKNVGFLCYESVQSIKSFMELQAKALSPESLSSYIWHNLGIIRNALVIKLSPQLTKSKKPKTYFNIYSPQSELHVDLDYYQAIKQLLLQVGLTKWQPCKQIDESKIIANLVKLTNKKWWNFGLKHLLCQLHEVGRKGKLKENQLWWGIDKSENINYFFQQMGIQAGTVEVLYNPVNQTMIVQQVNRLALSFLEEFVVLEDHLHSSATLYLPLSQSEYIPLKALIIPGISFLVASAAFLIIRAIKLLNVANQSQIMNASGTEMKDSSIKLGTSEVSPIIILLFFTFHMCLVQIYYNETIFISLTVALLTRIAIRNNLGHVHKQLVRIVVAGLSIFMCQYYSIFCFPLSLIMMLLTNILCFTSKIFSLAFLTFTIGIVMHFGELGLIEIMDEILLLSVQAQIIVFPLLLWVMVMQDRN